MRPAKRGYENGLKKGQEHLTSTDSPHAQHDRSMAELERHSPERHGASPSLLRLERRIVVPIVTVAVAIGAVVVYLIAGWLGVVLGALLFSVYYLIGWWPEIAAAVLRRKEHRRFEEKIADEHSSNREGSDSYGLPESDSSANQRTGDSQC